MKFLKFLGAVSIFEIAGFLIAIPIFLSFMWIADLFQMDVWFALMVIPALMSIILGIYFAKRFYSWIGEKEKKVQIFVCSCLVSFVVAAFLAEWVVEKQEEKNLLQKTTNFIQSIL